MNRVRKPFQFSIARLMGVTAIVGVFFAVARLAGLEGSPTLFAAALAVGAVIGTFINGWRGAVIGMVASTTFFSPLPLLALMGIYAFQVEWRRWRRIDP